MMAFDESFALSVNLHSKSGENFCFYCVWLVIRLDRVAEGMEERGLEWSTVGSKARDPNRGRRNDGSENEGGGVAVPKTRESEWRLRKSGSRRSGPRKRETKWRLRKSGSRRSGAEEEGDGVTVPKKREQKKCATLNWLRALAFLGPFFCSSFTSSYRGYLLIHHGIWFLTNPTSLLSGFVLFEE